MIELLRHEAITGFRNLVGTRIAGTIPLTQALLNDVIGSVPQVPRGLHLDIHPTNRIVARYGGVQATALLDETVHVGGPPRVHLELASITIAWALKQTLHMPAVVIDGRRVTIDLGAIPSFDEYRSIWQHLRSVKLWTTLGTIHVDFEFAVTEGMS